MKRTNVAGVSIWNVFQPDRRIDFNGFYWQREAGSVLIDPMPMGPETASAVETSVAWILLTCADHLRAAPQLAKQFGAKIAAPSCDREALAEAPIDAWFDHDTPLPDALSEDIEVRWIHGGKTQAEAVFYLRPCRAILFGDAVRSHESGVLRLLPDAKISDRDALIADVQALRNLNFASILLGDGDCLFTGAHGAFLSFLRELD